MVSGVRTKAKEVAEAGMKRMMMRSKERAKRMAVDQQ